MTFNRLPIKATIAVATFMSAVALSSPAEAVKVKSSVVGNVLQQAGVELNEPAAPGAVLEVNSDTLVDAVGKAVVKTDVLPEPVSAIVTDATDNSLQVGIGSEETLVEVNESLTSKTEAFAPIVPAQARALVTANLGVDAGPIAKANADACVGAGVNQNAPGCGGGNQEIPTPALLPGLIAFGVGLFRKHKGEQQEAQV